MSRDSLRFVLMGMGVFSLWGLMTLGGQGCSFTAQDQVSHWKGLHRQELIGVLGRPKEETELEGGGSRLRYVKETVVHPSASQLYGRRIICKMTFETDSRGTIIRAAQEGNC